MIKDNIKNAKVYFKLSKGIKKGFEWIINNDLQNLPDGKYVLDENNYANLQSYETKKSALFEAHRDYIDIQYMVKGKEKCCVCNPDTTFVVEDYNKDNDIEFLDSTSWDEVTLKTGEFLIFFPHDVHKPALNINKKNIVKKVIVKVHI